jgi:hypothetical protein
MVKGCVPSSSSAPFQSHSIRSRSASSLSWGGPSGFSSKIIVAIGVIEGRK